MYKITVTAILQKHGKWIKSPKLVKLIAEKRGVHERQAYNILKKALNRYSGWFEEKIIKHVYDDRTVIYGLPEFGPPTLEGTPANLGFFDYLDRRAERKLREKQYEDEKIDRNIRELDCRIAIRRELAHLDPKDPEYPKKVNETKFRLRKQYDLI